MSLLWKAVKYSFGNYISIMLVVAAALLVVIAYAIDFLDFILSCIRKKKDKKSKNDNGKIETRKERFQSLLLNVSYSIIAAGIFFVFQVVVPEINDQALWEPFINEQIQNAYYTISDIDNYYDLINYQLDNSSPHVLNIDYTEADLKEDRAFIIRYTRLHAQEVHSFDQKLNTMLESDKPKYPKPFLKVLFELQDNQRYQFLLNCYDEFMEENQGSDFSLLASLDVRKDNLFSEAEVDIWQAMEEAIKTNYPELFPDY